MLKNRIKNIKSIYGLRINFHKSTIENIIEISEELENMNILKIMSKERDGWYRFGFIGNEESFDAVEIMKQLDGLKLKLNLFFEYKVG